MPAKPSVPDRIALGVVAVLVLPLIATLLWGLGQQLLLAHRMQVEERRLEDLVAEAQARHEQLLTRLEYVRSDEYVEHWARAEAGMARPGEVTVVLLGRPDDQTPDDVDRGEGPFWQGVRDLFADR